MKVLSKKVGFRVLESRLREKWNLHEGFELLDLEKGFFLSRILEEGPWTIHGHYITISKWKPGFRPTNADIKTTLVWA